MAETPVKDRLPRGKRGEKRSEGKEAMMVEVQDVEEDEEEDELGPSPLKPLDGEKRTFTSLLVEADVHAQGRNEAKKKVRENEKRGRPSEMLGLFGKASKGKEKGRPGASTRHPTPSTSTPPPRASDLSTDDVSDPPPIPSPAPIDEPATEAGSSEEMSTPPDELLEAAAAQISLSRPSRPSKILSLSDDEEDEWDSEGGRKQRTVVIVPTRRPVRRRDSDDDPIHHEEAENGAEQDEEDNDEAVPVPPLVEGTTATSTTLPSSPTTTTLAPPLLSLLSLNSPSSRSKQSRLADLRVKAIFNPTDATRLRAIKRGQEIFVPGEGGEEGEEEKIMEAYEEGDAAGEGDQEGDVDWESENEGWKRTAIGMEDDDDGW